MVNPVLGADGDNPLHIWSARLCKFLSATRKKQFVLVLVIMQWRAAAGRSDLRPQGNSTSGLRTAKMDDNFFTKRIQRVAPASRDSNGKRLSDHLHEIAANSEL